MKKGKEPPSFLTKERKKKWVKKNRAEMTTRQNKYPDNGTKQTSPFVPTCPSDATNKRASRQNAPHGGEKMVGGSGGVGFILRKRGETSLQ